MLILPTTNVPEMTTGLAEPKKDVPAAHSDAACAKEHH